MVSTYLWQRLRYNVFLVLCERRSPCQRIRGNFRLHKVPRSHLGRSITCQFKILNLGKNSLNSSNVVNKEESNVTKRRATASSGVVLGKQVCYGKFYPFICSQMNSCMYVHKYIHVCIPELIHAFFIDYAWIEDYRLC